MSESNGSVRFDRKPFRSRAKELTEDERADLNSSFKTKLKPALEHWCGIYAGHVPFQADTLTTDQFYEKIGRPGSSSMFIFMLNGTTLGIEDLGNSARVSYLNTPDSKRLMDMPSGSKPDPTIPITRADLIQILKQDSGIDFSPNEIRVIPTAFSSGMNGGAHVIVGGDPNNIASWKFTMVFSPDGNLNYYCRGH